MQDQMILDKSYENVFMPMIRDDSNIGYEWAEIYSDLGRRLTDNNLTNQCYEFINANRENVYDMSKAYFKGKCHFTQTTDNAKTQDITPVNNLMSMLFNRVELYIGGNNEMVESISNHGLVDTSLKYVHGSTEWAESQGKESFWVPDTETGISYTLPAASTDWSNYWVTHEYDTDIHKREYDAGIDYENVDSYNMSTAAIKRKKMFYKAAVNDGTGAVANATQTKEGVHFIWTPRLGIFESGKLLTNCSWSIKLYRDKNEMLYTAGSEVAGNGTTATKWKWTTDKGNMSFTLDELILCVPIKRPETNTLLRMKNAMAVNPVIYQFDTYRVNSVAIPANHTASDFSAVVAMWASTPKRVYIFIQSDMRQTEYANSASFDHCNISSMYITIDDNKRYPITPMPTDFAAKYVDDHIPTNVTEPILELRKAQFGTQQQYIMGSQLTTANFNRHPIWIFDTSKGMNQNPDPNRNACKITVHINGLKTYNNSYKLYIVGLVDKVVQIDGGNTNVAKNLF